MPTDRLIDALDQKMASEGVDSFLELVQDGITKILTNAAVILAKYDGLGPMRQGTLLPELMDIAEETVAKFRRFMK